MTTGSDLRLIHLSQPPRQDPPPGQKPPLLLLLHGIGSNEWDLYGLVPYLDDRFHVLSLRAPITLAPNSFAWFEVHFSPTGPRIRPDQAEASRQRLITFIEKAPAIYGTEPGQVYLMGFSQGAIMSLALTLTRPDLLAAVVAMSGRTLPELFEPQPPLGGHLAPVEELEDFPLLVVHGLQDQVLPIHYGRATQEHFAPLPVQLAYKEYDIGHTISQESLADISAWLTALLEGRQAT